VSDLDARFAPLRARFLQRLTSERISIEASASEGSRAAGEDVGRRAHKIAGMGGSLGFQKLSTYAKAVDVRASTEPDTLFQSQEYSVFVDEVVRLTQED
jgi:HPt (histidine-containing phosphotransfer) domain-containing protein